MSEATSQARLRQASPSFVVEDVIATAEYYREVLGFQFDTFYGNPPSFVILRRDGVLIMLKQLTGATRQSCDTGPPDFLDAYFWVDDVDVLVAEFRRRGADIVVEPTNREIYNGRDLYVRDLDGRILCFGQILE